MISILIGLGAGALCFLAGYVAGSIVASKRSTKNFLAAVNKILEVCEEESPT